MAFIRYATDQELPSADRVPDSDNILQIHGVHPHVMHQHYQLYLELMHREGPSHGVSGSCLPSASPRSMGVTIDCTITRRGSVASSAHRA